MPTPQQLLQEIASDLSRETAKLAPLGDATSPAELSLATPEGRAQYANILQPSIDAAIAHNSRQEWTLIAMLIVLFAAATGLAVVAPFRGWQWASAAAIPGLGVTAAWPVRTLLRMRGQNLALASLPALLPFLPPDKAAALVLDFLGKRL